MEHKDGLASLDRKGHRIFIIPAEVKGFFRKWRTLSQWLLIVLFLILPWSKMNGMQTLWLDIPNRKFAIFGRMFYAHDGPLIFFILLTATISLALATAVWGRIWCGWACPQTVFIDAIYRQIEIWVEGKYIERRKLLQAPMSFAKFTKVGLKWFLFLIVSSLISHSFIAYFTGAEQLVDMIQGGPQENWSYFLFVSVMTGILLFDFGWFREQFCIIVCPYGKFQSVLMDHHSYTVLYDAERGEPRRGSVVAANTEISGANTTTVSSGSSPAKTGDCVACNRCVQVCPTGIDIRNGLQLECIGCTACIDACDEIMEKVKKPKKLIRYASVKNRGLKIFRPRVLIYSFILLIGVSGILFNFFSRSSFMVTLLRAKDTPYQVVKGQHPITQSETDMVINHFKLHIHNQTDKIQNYEIKPSVDFIQAGAKMTLQNPLVEVGASQEKIIHFFVIAPKANFNPKGEWSSSVSIEEKNGMSKQASELNSGVTDLAANPQVAILQSSQPENVQVKKLQLVGPNN